MREPGGAEQQAPGRGGTPPEMIFSRSTAGQPSWLAWLARFVAENILHVRPKPFDFGRVDAIALAAGSNWLDNNQRKLSPRRAWALVNTNMIAGNDVWINFSNITALGQGGWVAAGGGTASIPANHKMNIFAWPVLAGTVVSFYQFG